MNVTKGTLWTPLIAVAVFCLYGCSRPVLDYRNVQIVNGKIFAGDADKPFSGTVTNFPDNELLAHQRGFNGFAYAITHVNTSPKTAVVEYLGFSSPGMMFSQTSSFCTVVVDDGLPDGTAKCVAANSDVTGTEMSFSKGALDGDMTYFNFDHSRYPISQVSFDGDGEPDGKQKIYSMKTGKVIHTLNWDDGTVTGTEEGYDEQSEKLIVHAHDKKGKLDGEENGYDGQTGAHIYQGDYVDGKPDGTHQWWDASGKLTEQRTFKDGVLVREVSAQVAQVDTPSTPPTNNPAAEASTTQAAAATPPPAPPSTVAIAASVQSVPAPVATPASTDVRNTAEASWAEGNRTYQPGFDCTKAQTPAETTICGDPLLSALDFDVAAQYRALAQQAALSQKGDLLTSQREYLAARSICGSDRACLQRQTRSRLHDLRQQATQTPGVLIATLKSDHVSVQ